MASQQAVEEACALVRGTYWNGWQELRLVLGAGHLDVGSPMRHLPKELLQKIGRLCYRPRAFPHFDELTSEKTEHIARAFDVTELAVQSAVKIEQSGRRLVRQHCGGVHGETLPAVMPRTLTVPDTGLVQYFELSFFAWGGTAIAIETTSLPEGLREPTEVLFGYHSLSTRTCAPAGPSSTSSCSLAIPLSDGRCRCCCLFNFS